MSLPVVLLGGGGHASVLASTLGVLGRTIAGCIAPVPSARLLGVRYLGTGTILASIGPVETEMTAAVGSIAATDIRKTLYEKTAGLGFQFAKIIHPSALVDGFATLGNGVQLWAGANIQAGAGIGDNAVVNSGAIIEHGCQIGEHVHVASGAVLAGDVKEGSCSHVGAGAVILQGCTIGEYATIGAAACVTPNVAGGATVADIPAREHKGRSGSS